MDGTLRGDLIEWMLDWGRVGPNKVYVSTGERQAECSANDEGISDG